MKPMIGQVSVPERKYIGMGHVSEFSEQRMVVRAGVAAPHLPFWRQGLAASVNFVVGDTVYHGAAAVDTFSTAKIGLHIHSVNRSMDSRSSSRKQCAVDLAFRIMRADRSFTPWRQGRSIDISIGGIGVLVPASLETPQRMDLQLVLRREPAPDVDAANLPGANDGTDTRSSSSTRLEAAQIQNMTTPIRCRGRVVHSMDWSDGTKKLGLEFIALDPYAMLHIYNFVTTSESEQSGL